MWSKDRLKIHLCHYADYKGNEPFYVGQYFDNAWVDEAFGQLTETEKYLLTELYINGSIDKGDLETNIYITENAYQKVMEETGLTKYGIDLKVRYAIGTMLNYLNGGEKNVETK